ncbi:MAG: Gp49 family protein [Parabacteroides sp.]|nr:Gp49 family protein [Parabacteroides sp.]
MSKENTLTKEHIEELIHSSEFTYSTQFGKCTVVSMQLPNGFVLTESSACVDPKNYDEKLGCDICIRKLTEKVWELEGYLLQDDLYYEELLKTAPDRMFQDLTVAMLNDAGFKGKLTNGSVALELTGEPITKGGHYGL